MSGEDLRKLQEQNARLAQALTEARDRIGSLAAEVELLSKPPATFGVVLNRLEDGLIDIVTGGRKMRVVTVGIKSEELMPGVQVILNEGATAVSVLPPDRLGDVVKVIEVLDDRVMVAGTSGDDQHVAWLAGDLATTHVRVGDSLRYDARAGVALELLPKTETSELVLEEIPDVDYEDIGGLAAQIEDIRDAVELPFLNKQLFKEYQLEAPKGILLYGPPGCGKTLIAKAVAKSLAEQVGAHQTSYFLNVKGPELLNKFVGETERQIRQIFIRAKELSDGGHPVIVFFDEMESIFRTRGTGISSDVESTIVPQLLSELDGVEALKNVIVIGASNREDLIDPAILRPGRLDVKIKIERPDEEAAVDIMSKYLHDEIPIDAAEVEKYGGIVQACEAMVTRTVHDMYEMTERNRFLEVTYASGDKEILYFKDFNSGAMTQNIVRRAKKEAIKRERVVGRRGVQLDDLLTAIRDEFKENEDLPNTTNPDDWARISGKKGERIIYVRILLGERAVPGKQIESVSPGQYL